MKLLVCGSRDEDDYKFVEKLLEAFHKVSPITELIHGGCRGVDTLAGNWAIRNKIAVRVFKADWAKYGREAGPLRNHAMLVQGKPDRLLAFPGGYVTQDMVRRAKAAGVPIDGVQD